MSLALSGEKKKDEVKIRLIKMRIIKKKWSVLQDETVHTVRRWGRLWRTGGWAGVGEEGERWTESRPQHCDCTLPALSQNATCWYPVCPGDAHGSWRPISLPLTSNYGDNGFGMAELLPVSSNNSTSPPLPFWPVSPKDIIHWLNILM